MIDRFEQVDVVCVLVSLLFRNESGRDIFFETYRGFDDE